MLERMHSMKTGEQDILPEWTTRDGPKAQQNGPQGKENEGKVDQKRDGKIS